MGKGAGRRRLQDLVAEFGGAEGCRAEQAFFAQNCVQSQLWNAAAIDTNLPLPPDTAVRRALGPAKPHLSTFRVKTFCALGARPTVLDSIFLKIGAPGEECDNTAKPGRVVHFFAKDGTLRCSYESMTGLTDDQMNMFYPTDRPGDVGAEGASRAEGAKLPDFDKLSSLVARAHSLLFPEVMLIGWDVALTRDRGWVLIEPNICARYVSMANYEVAPGNKDASSPSECEIYERFRDMREQHFDWLIRGGARKAKSN